MYPGRIHSLHEQSHAPMIRHHLYLIAINSATLKTERIRWISLLFIISDGLRIKYGETEETMHDSSSEICQSRCSDTTFVAEYYYL